MFSKMIVSVISSKKGVGPRALFSISRYLMHNLSVLFWLQSLADKRDIYSLLLQILSVHPIFDIPSLTLLTVSKILKEFRLLVVSKKAYDLCKTYQFFGQSLFYIGKSIFIYSISYSYIQQESYLSMCLC